MNTALVLAAHGPVQSWGVESKLGSRRTGPVPTRSAVMGLLMAALGVGRADRLDHDVLDPAQLEVFVRVDAPGTQIVDLHNITAGAMKGSGLRYGATIMSHRWYLADAAFLIAVAGPAWQVDGWSDAIHSPRWALSLGRRACPPAAPFCLGVTDDWLETFEMLPRLGTDHDLPLRVCVPDRVQVSRTGWIKAPRGVASATNPVTETPRTFATERIETYDVSAAHSGGLCGPDPLRLVEATEALRCRSI